MGSNFDVEGYASQFTKQGRVARLLYVASHSKGETQAEAFKLAIQELRQGSNTVKYGDAVKAARESGCIDINFDSDWVAAKEAALANKEAALEHELKMSKTNLVTQNIRYSYQAMGDFMYAKGNYNEALKNYARSKDYCTQTSDVLKCCLECAKVSIETRNSQNVSNYVLIAEQAPDYQANTNAVAKLNAVQGLAHLQARQYKRAALRLTKVTGGSSFSWREMISPQEIALYGALCGLAEFTRSELKANVIDNVTFREFLDTYAPARELVNDFYNSRYAPLLATLEQLRPRLLLDVNLYSLSPALCTSVRNKALVQYTSSFITISLPKMAAAFSTDIGTLEADIVKLIQSGDIPARIDSGSQVLYKTTTDLRAKAHRAVLASGEEYLRLTRALLLRASLQRYNLVERPSSGKPRAGQTQALNLPRVLQNRGPAGPPGFDRVEDEELQSLHQDTDLDDVGDEIMEDDPNMEADEAVAPLEL